MVCGLSIGGCVAEDHAARHSDRVSGLVLAYAFGTGPVPLSARLLFANLGRSPSSTGWCGTRRSIGGDFGSATGCRREWAATRTGSRR
jgi:pimeloyl-ACP methyl ester carboxylesterase